MYSVMDSFIEKLIILEKRIGASTGYKMLEPFFLNTTDIIRIQDAAKVIADFIGVGKFTYIVTPVELAENVGGHIELQHNEKEVFIEISKETLNYQESVLATLAHEVTHKYLHYHGVSLGHGPAYKHQNEVLTDIAAVFLGLGKLMLNGCQAETKEINYTSGEIQTITKTLNVGYITREQLAFVFLLVCKMRGIPEKEYFRGLSSDAANELRWCQTEYKHIFDCTQNKRNSNDEKINEYYAVAKTSQLELAHIDRDLLFLKTAYYNVIEQFLNEKHKTISNLREQISEYDTKDYDPCLNFLKIIQFESKLNQFITQERKSRYEIALYRDTTHKLVELVRSFGSVYLHPSEEMFNIVVCRNDGTRIKVPKNKSEFSLKCPKCQYFFIADTSSPGPVVKDSNRKTRKIKNISIEPTLVKIIINYAKKYWYPVVFIIFVIILILALR